MSDAFFPPRRLDIWRASLSQRRYRLMAAAMFLGAFGCGERARKTATGGVRDAAAVADTVAPSDRLVADLGDGAPAERAGFTELPRLTANPALTRRLIEGPATLMGYGVSGCSHGAGLERWCAFSRPAQGGEQRAELWVINISKVNAGLVVSCDQAGGAADAGCIRLTSNLFTGQQSLWGVYHPFDHRFEGDTLIFYADALPDTPDPYIGPVYAWRPGWVKARQLTSSRGGNCFAEHRVPVAYCTDSVVTQDNPDEFVPNTRELDLLAGSLDAAATGPLPRVAHLASDGPSRLDWQARFSPKGDYFAFSYVPQGGDQEAVQVVRTADIGGPAVPTTVANASLWQIAHDGTKLYYLKDYIRATGVEPAGTLTIADFPSGQTPVSLRTNVSTFDLLGAHDEVFSDVDRGLAFSVLQPGGAWILSVMHDRDQPSQVHRIGTQPKSAQVATDGMHAVYLEARDGVAYAVRTNGSSPCMLTNDRDAETYGAHFSDSGDRVFWIEYNRENSGSEEGWYASSATCQGKTKYGDYVTGYHLVGDDFVVFDGGDVSDETSWLQYSPLVPGGGPAASPLPTIIVENPGSVSLTGSGDRTFVLYTTSPETMGGPGLYIFGPLQRSP